MTADKGTLDDATAQRTESEEVSAETTSAFRADFRDELREATAADTERAAAVEGLPSGAGMLVVKRGPNAGSRFLLDEPVTSAGRHPDSDIFLDDVTVSRRHAEFHLESDEFRVVDVGSLNGTYVNREPVDSAVLATVTRSRSESSGWCSYAVDLVPVDLYLC